VNLVGFSDGSLSGDVNNGGYSWIVAVVENGVIPEGGVLALLAARMLVEAVLHWRLTTQMCC
jgi:hypothetical protein